MTGLESVLFLICGVLFLICGTVAPSSVASGVDGFMWVVFLEMHESSRFVVKHVYVEVLLLLLPQVLCLVGVWDYRLWALERGIVTSHGVGNSCVMIISSRHEFRPRANFSCLLCRRVLCLLGCWTTH